MPEEILLLPLTVKILKIFYCDSRAIPLAVLYLLRKTQIHLLLFHSNSILAVLFDRYDVLK
jgi:hypothetical protein